MKRIHKFKKRQKKLRRLELISKGKGNPRSQSLRLITIYLNRIGVNLAGINTSDLIALYAKHTNSKIIGDPIEWIKQQYKGVKIPIFLKSKPPAPRNQPKAKKITIVININDASSRYERGNYDHYLLYLRSAVWRRRRNRILERDGNRCVKCFIPNGESILHIHHLTYDRLFNENDDDLITLCEDCHNNEHKRLNLLKRTA